MATQGDETSACNITTQGDGALAAEVSDAMADENMPGSISSDKIKLAIIGASDFQNPLILAAKERGIETHVFAWEAGDIGERTADYFYPISITEVDVIARECRRIGVDGVACIGSDLGNITASAVAEQLGLTANSMDCVRRSTNKHLMRATFEACGDPTPRSFAVSVDTDLAALDLDYPVIVKPADRSGSRGITKLLSSEGLTEAVARALDESFAKHALIEEFVEGKEYSVEYISWQGKHHFLAVTEKFTTGAPRFIERGHLEPARITLEQKQALCAVVEHALSSLGVEYGASHSELKITPDGTITIIEIGSRMGGDCIGSHLVKLSCGYDFVNAVIDVALGQAPQGIKGGYDIPLSQKSQLIHQDDGEFLHDSDMRHQETAEYCQKKDEVQLDGSNTPVSRAAAVRFVFNAEDRAVLETLQTQAPDCLEYVSEVHAADHDIVDSGSRYGFFIFSGDSVSHLEQYLPE